MFLRNKEAAIRDLATNVREIRDNIDANQGALDNMINDYKSVLQNNAKMLKNIASSIVDKLNRNIYKKNYGNERKKYVKGYDSIQKYMNKLVDEEMIDKDDSVLAPLSEIAKRGGK